MTVYDEIEAEVERAAAKFPGQVLPWAHYPPKVYAAEVDRWRQINDGVGRVEPSWDSVLSEEVCEALAETDPQAMRAELIQVAAVVVRMVAQIDGGQRWADNPRPLPTPQELYDMDVIDTLPNRGLEKALDYLREGGYGS